LLLGNCIRAFPGREACAAIVRSSSNKDIAAVPETGYPKTLRFLMCSKK